VTPEGLREFGYKVRDARTRKGWTLEALAQAALENPERKGYLSQIENGKRPLSARTIGNLARVLDLPESVTRPLLFAPAPEDEVTREDRLAETLIRRNDADPAASPTAEALMIALAYEYAEGSHIDLQTAYAGLRGALDAYTQMKAQIDRIGNMDDQLSAILLKVEYLNRQGLRDDAGEALDAAIKAKEAELDALHEAALNQDRVRNRPKAAADRLIARLKASAPPGGVFLATRDLLNEWRERGERMGNLFDLAVALDLARLNHARAKGPQLGQALLSLGNCHSALGERQSGGGHLTRALRAFTEALEKHPREQQPENWAGTQLNLGNVMQVLGKRAGSGAYLPTAIDAYNAALTVYTPEATPKDWAMTQNNLGTALQGLGKQEDDSARLQAAIDAFSAALTVYTPDATPTDWAATQNNLGTSLQTLGELKGDSARLYAAISAYAAALTVSTPEIAPMDWAGTQHNLAIVCLSLHDQDKKADWLEKAEDAFGRALTRRTREAGDYLWAATHCGLGNVSLARFKLTGDRNQLDRARGYLTEARAVFALDPNNVTLQDFDRLLAEINAA
jgi:tetratricopeptide (TPR) repeat protein